MSEVSANQKSSKPFLFIVGSLIGAGGLFLFIVMSPHGPAKIAPHSVVPQATSEMPVPVIEKVEPSESAKKAIDSAEEAMLQKLENTPESSPARFEPYGTFAQQAEGAGMYDVADLYYKKAFVLGPAAYKNYFAKPAGDFQLNWSSMHVNIGQLQEAAAIAEKVYDQEIKVLGAESEQAVEAGTTLACDLGYVKRYADKQTLSEKLIALLEKMGKTKDGDYVTALRCLAESYQGQNKLPEAKHWYLKSLAVASAKPELSSYTENLEQTLTSFETIKTSE